MVIEKRTEGMKMFDHLNALELRLSNERVRLENSKTAREREMRTVWVTGIEKEIASERKFLGLTEVDAMNLDEILTALEA